MFRVSKRKLVFQAQIDQSKNKDTPELVNFIGKGFTVLDIPSSI